MFSLKQTHKIFPICLNKTFPKFFSTEINLVLPNLKKVSMKMEDSNTFEDIENNLRNQKYLEKVQFRSWDHSNIAKTNDLKSYFSNNEMFFFQYDRSEWQVVSKDENLHDTNINPKDFGSEAEFKLIQDVVGMHNKNRQISEDELFKLSLSLFKLRNSHHEYSNLIKNKASLSELYEEYYRIKSDYARMCLEEDKYIRSAEKRARLLILLAGLVLVAQLALISYGTFVVYTWDITEPMTYLLGCFNIVVFLVMRRKFGNLTAFEYYTNKFFARIVKRNKFDNLKLEANRLKIKEIEEFLN
jgi:hypothetical protein